MSWAEKGTSKFASIPFPWTKMEIRGGARFQHHKAPHVDGSIAELLGRETYEFKFTLPANNELIQFPGFYDDTWPKLRGFFELSTQDELEIQGIGKIDAWASSWVESRDAKNQSGAVIEISFFEDTNNLFLDADAVGREASSLSSVVEAFQIERQAYDAIGFADATRAPTMTIQRWNRLKQNMASLEVAALQLVAYRDKYELYVRSQLTQVNRVLDLVGAVTNDLDHELFTFQSLRDALGNLWGTTRRFKDTVVRVEPIEHITPIAGSVSQIAKLLYGEHKHIVDILHLNVIPRPLQIPLGTRLLVPRPTKEPFRRQGLASSL